MAMPPIPKGKRISVPVQSTASLSTSPSSGKKMPKPPKVSK